MHSCSPNKLRAFKITRTLMALVYLAQGMIADDGIHETSGHNNVRNVFKALK
jgi:hypothetical protein